MVRAYNVYTHDIRVHMVVIVLNICNIIMTTLHSSVCLSPSSLLAPSLPPTSFHYSGGYGGWSGRGCVLVNETENEVMCECDHLTNFAILLVSHLISDGK